MPQERVNNLKCIFYKYIFSLEGFAVLLQLAYASILLLRQNAVILIRRDAGTNPLPSTMEDWVVMGAASIEFLLGPLLMWAGRERRPLSLAACLAASAISAILVLFFPYHGSAQAGVELCNGNLIEAYSSNVESIDAVENVAVYRITFLIITVIMCSLSTFCVWSHGLTYLDDHEPGQAPIFFASLILLRLTLGVNEQSFITSPAYGENWRTTFIVLTSLVFIFSIIIAFYPNRMENWKLINVDDDMGFLPSLKRVMCNRVVTLQILALSLLNAAFLGLLRYDNEYVQARYHIETVWSDPRTSRSLTKFLRNFVPSAVVLIFKQHFTNRRSDGIKSSTAAKTGGVLAIFVAINWTVMAILNCEIGDIVGIEGDGWVQPHCSSECGCDSSKYGFTPVCVIETGVTHFSPCTTGCHQYEDLSGLLLFDNCTCGSGRIVRGSCSLPSCYRTHNTYEILYMLNAGFTAASLMMQGLVVLRAVHRWDKFIAQGFAIGSVTVLSRVPGHILYMLISDFTCAYPGESGVSCIFHRPTLWWAVAASAILALFSGILTLFSRKILKGSKHNVIIGC